MKTRCALYSMPSNRERRAPAPGVNVQTAKNRSGEIDGLHDAPRSRGDEASSRRNDKRTRTGAPSSETSRHPIRAYLEQEVTCPLTNIHTDRQHR